MTKEEFEAKYPMLLGWIQQTLAQYTSEARPLSSLGFKRLPFYFQSDILRKAKVVYLSKIPVPPLTAMGLRQLSEFENMDGKGVTYLDTFFVRNDMRDTEALHFHELAHVIQWQSLGPKQFLATYADGLERIRYRGSPLEVMAYTLESVFRNSQAQFDVAPIVREQLHELYA